MTIRKILVIKFRNIGDVLLSTPLLENLRFFYPAAEIHMAVNAMCVEMLSLNPHLDRILSYDRDTVKNARPWQRIVAESRLFRQIRAQGYDLVINLTEGDRGALLALFSGAPLRLGIQPRNALLKRLPVFTREVETLPYVHTVERDLLFLTWLGHTPQTKRVRIDWSAETEAEVRALLAAHGIRHYVHVHPVARWLFKCWDAQRFAAVIDYLETVEHLRVVLTASPDPVELARVEEITAACQSRPLDLSGRLSLKAVACLSRHARFFLGVDTAPMHMAAAMDTPVIALFGPSQPVLWGPWDNDLDTAQYQDVRGRQHNGKHVLLQKGEDQLVMQDGRKISTALMRITVEEVVAAISECRTLV